MSVGRAAGLGSMPIAPVRDLRTALGIHCETLVFEKGGIRPEGREAEFAGVFPDRVSIARPPKDASYDCRNVNLRDPRGNLIALGTALQPSAAGPAL